MDGIILSIFLLRNCCCCSSSYSVCLLNLSNTITKIIRNVVLFVCLFSFALLQNRAFETMPNIFFFQSVASKNIPKICLVVAIFVLAFGIKVTLFVVVVVVCILWLYTSEQYSVCLVIYLLFIVGSYRSFYCKLYCVFVFDFTELKCCGWKCLKIIPSEDLKN